MASHGVGRDAANSVGTCSGIISVSVQQRKFVQTCLRATGTDATRAVTPTRARSRFVKSNLISTRNQLDSVVQLDA